MSKNSTLRKIILMLGIAIIIYIIICDILMSISITMNCCFIGGAILLFANYYMLLHPIDRRENEPSFIYIFVKIAATAYFSIILLLIAFNLIYPKNKLDNNKKYDYIIVFGAGIKDDKTEIINSRLDRAIEYAEKYRNCKFVLTGAKGYDEPIEEAIYMKQYMMQRGVEERRILVDPFSINTNENIQNSLELIKIDILRRNGRENIIPRPFRRDSKLYDLEFLNIGFMSSEFHLTRIELMAHKWGIGTPYVIECHTNPLYIPYQYVREDLSLFKALVLNQLEF